MNKPIPMKGECLMTPEDYRLYSAAPALLAALQDLLALNFFKSVDALRHGPAAESAKKLDAARAAVSAALGKQP